MWYPLRASSSPKKRKLTLGGRMGACDWSLGSHEPREGVHLSKEDPEGTTKVSTVLGLFQTPENHQVASLAEQPRRTATQAGELPGRIPSSLARWKAGIVSSKASRGVAKEGFAGQRPSKDHEKRRNSLSRSAEMKGVAVFICTPRTWTAVVKDIQRLCVWSSMALDQSSFVILWLMPRYRPTNLSKSGVDWVLSFETVTLWDGIWWGLSEVIWMTCDHVNEALQIVLVP